MQLSLEDSDEVLMIGIGQTATAIASDEFQAMRSEPEMRLTVLFTTAEGTMCALQTAARLSQGLTVRIVLVEIVVVPVQLPLDQPLVPVALVEDSLRVLVSESGVDADNISLQVCLGRDRRDCLCHMLHPRSLVIIGGTRGWLSPERRLVQWFNHQGHQAIFVDVDQEQTTNQREYHFLLSSPE